MKKHETKMQTMEILKRLMAVIIVPSVFESPFGIRLFCNIESNRIKSLQTCSYNACSSVISFILSKRKDSSTNCPDTFETTSQEECSKGCRLLES
ncbi:unnamed protein product [Allacma fusca]|uniref:Uncharacterized protein n=1 Tax=Allacma fusca TaxID=39272 RepID=A0A8J2NWK9_9HEXA|nr:unnamed protein product [Allacma fusca]